MIRRKFILRLFICLTLILINRDLISQSNDTCFIVGTIEAPPFSFKDTDGKWKGISIELWEKIADDMNICYRYQEHTVKGLLDSIKDGTLDAIVSSLTLTTEREAQFDFTHPFYNTGLGIAVHKQKGSVWQSVLRELTSAEFLEIVGVLLGTMFIIGVVVWLFERRKNKEFGGSAKSGIGSGLWWSIVTMTAVGYGDKVPKTIGGRMFAALWMFMGIVLVSSFIATITSILTVSQLEYSINGPEDLRVSTVGTIRYTTSEEYLRDNRIVYIDYTNIDEALQALDKGEVNAFVYDAPLLHYYINRDYKGRIEVLPHKFLRQDYGIALPEGSPVREPLNRLLLKHIHSEEWQNMIYKYLGDD
ncbi:MAG: transporter substrate-binding domain-containing protein [Bacteroidales bacterium]|jgi:ABC-type amino acid transport substrate-binding protein|nr:transporter substrate-binding domain-containing protein [Bacteroidales bacterium]